MNREAGLRFLKQAEQYNREKLEGCSIRSQHIGSGGDKQVALLKASIGINRAYYICQECKGMYGGLKSLKTLKREEEGLNRPITI